MNITKKENDILVDNMAQAAQLYPTRKNLDSLYAKVKRVAFAAYKKLKVDQDGGDRECFEGLAYLALAKALESWDINKGTFVYYYHSKAFYGAQCHIRSDNFAISLPTSYRVKKHGEIHGTTGDLGSSESDFQIEQDDYTDVTRNDNIIDPSDMNIEQLQFYNEIYVNMMKRKDYIQKYCITYQEYTIIKQNFEDYITETYGALF